MPSGNSNSPPLISGAPPTSIVVGSAYSFTPTASDSDGDKLNFLIANQPSWSVFDITSGQLSGTPTSAGTWNQIQISVSDGTDTSSLAPFDLIALSPDESISALPPRFEEWVTEMESVGHTWGQALNPAGGASFNDRLAWQYYDSQWIFQQVSQFRSETEPWSTYARYAEQVYRDEHLIPAQFRTQGFRRFPHGLLNDYLAGSDTTLNQVRQIRDEPAFSNLFEFRNQFHGNCEAMSREIAYAMQSNITAEKAGEPRKTEQGVDMYTMYLPWIEAHFYQWRNGGYGNYNSDCSQAEGFRFAPFMAGLSLHALIEFIDWELQNGRDPDSYWASSHWPDSFTMIDEFLDWIYTESTVRSGSRSGQKMWFVDSSTGLGTFRLQDRGEGEATDPAWELGNLIGPAYGWLGLQYARRGTKDDRLRAVELFIIGDQIFAGAVANAWVEGNGKFYNQNYRWSFDYIEWRREAHQLLISK